MSLSPSAISSLAARLEHGWSESKPDVALEALQILKEKFAGALETKEPGDDQFSFRMNLNSVRLRGADCVYGLLTGGNSHSALRAATEYWRQTSGVGRIVMILTGSETSHRAAVAAIPSRAAMILSPHQVEHLMAEEKPLQFWKQQLCRQIDKSQLLPFDIEHPAAANMFLGRDEELDMLAGASSLAIAGPGRIGKTSLLLEHRRRLVRNRDPRIHSTSLIDFYYCSNKNPNGVARFLAMRLNPTKRNSTITADELEHFLRTEKARQGCVPELLLDEVDEVIDLSPFNTLGHAAREGVCRIVLAGRSQLYKTINNNRSVLNCRLELIKPEPLNWLHCRQLFLETFADLGYRIAEEDKVLELILNLSGGLPQHIHFLGGRLFHLLTKRSEVVISPQLIACLDDDFKLGHYLRSALLGLQSDYQPVAESLLKWDSQAFGASAIQAAFEECGRPRPGLADACNFADDLVLQNFLVWRGGLYRLANATLAGRHVGLSPQPSAV